MSIVRLAAIIICIVIAGCKGKKGDSAKRINLIEKSPIKTGDSSLAPYYKNKYYLPYIVRLDKKAKSAFIQIDTAYFNTQKLDNNTREDYYNKAIALQPKDDLQAFRAVWSLPEMRDLQQGDGGYGTIVTWIKERADQKNKAYIIEIRRNDVEQLSLVKGTSFFRIRLHPQSIEIADESGYFVTLQAWRTQRKK